MACVANVGCPVLRGDKIGPTGWASPVRPELGLGWAIKLLTQKNRAKFGPTHYGPAWPGRAEFFFSFKRLFGLTGPIFRAGWAVKILARKNRGNFGPTRFWPSPLLAQPGPARPARLPALPVLYPCLQYLHGLNTRAKLYT